MADSASFTQHHHIDTKSDKRKVQGMPQSQTATNSRHQEEEKTEKTSTHNTNKHMYEKHKDQLSLLQARWSEC